MISRNSVGMQPVFSIARFVEEARVASGGPVSVDLLPNGRTTLVARIVERGSGDVHVVGPRTRAKFKRATGVARAVVIQFKPGWSPTLFGVPANQLTDQLVTLEDLWGSAGRDVTAELLATQSVPELLDRLSRAIAARAPSESASARLARRAARMFEARETRVETVADELGVSTRHLRRAFVESVGIAPKEFARGVRLQRAIGESASSKDWSVIARDAGYYDQAHLIGDFRDLTGLTPSAFVARRAAPITSSRPSHS
jgi:AraC-like DNA-binding protein